MFHCFPIFVSKGSSSGFTPIRNIFFYWCILRYKKKTNVMNFDMLLCYTVSTVILGKSNVLSDWTLKNISYRWALLFNCWVLQGHVTGIFQTILALLIIKMYQIFRHILSHHWTFYVPKSKAYISCINLFNCNCLSLLLLLLSHTASSHHFRWYGLRCIGVASPSWLLYLTWYVFGGVAFSGAIFGAEDGRGDTDLFTSGNECDRSTEE